MSAFDEALEQPQAERADRRGIALLTVAHVANDANQSAIPSLLPFLIGHHGLSYATAASLVLAMNLSSSIVQPLFGHLSDRRSMAWVIPTSLVLASAGAASIGLAPNFSWMLLGALISGIGIAAFHPEGSRYSNYFAGAKRASGMGWFTVGGYGGFALGPILVTPLLLTFGLHGTAFLIVPGLVLAALLVRDLPRFERAREGAHARRHHIRGRDDWRGFSMLAIVVAARSTVFLGAVTFLPLLAIHVLHASKGAGEAVLACMLVCGAVGTVAGGRLADRFGRRAIVTVSLAVASLGGAGLATLSAFGQPLLSLAVCAGGFGAAIGLSAGVIVVLGQEYLPHRIGIASGVTLGLAVTIGGIFAPIFGVIGDRYGLPTIFDWIAGFAALAFLCSFAMPNPNHGANESTR
jgi:FSR family fosmidomycin resistance protein-like MFS transporter